MSVKRVFQSLRPAQTNFQANSSFMGMSLPSKWTRRSCRPSQTRSGREPSRDRQREGSKRDTDEDGESTLDEEDERPALVLAGASLGKTESKETTEGTSDGGSREEETDTELDRLARVEDGEVVGDTGRDQPQQRQGGYAKQGEPRSCWRNR